ncbi:MAG TPA: phytanoyl-CoA dioxygenase family protein, partial [Abditibacteriaceae bacterium]|nr:phytanoyl-CoA dioxygenase family protein [Abditibacteriaceae bacterium]
MSTATETSTINLDPATSDIPRIEVPKPLTEKQVQEHIDNGFVIVPDVINREEINEVVADMIKLLRGGYDCPSLQPLPESLSDEAVMNSFLGLLQPHYVSPVISRYVKHPLICGMLSQLVAAHLPFWDGSVKCMQSMVFTKPPDYPGQAWHQDELYIPTRDHSLTGAWVALDDATVENGCLYVIPQSHRMGYLYPQYPHERPGEWDFAPQSYGFDDSGAIPVEVKAGDVIFFNGYVLHCSFKNRS